ncbi:potassium channel family protein [Marinobacterium aestuariivivens]|uniref:Potassium channel family protein n=1 Tax=Marinobacterium aestuariivivens TaxID=1698799 RepID=A0ABW2A6P6_9GAMM
MRVVLIGTNPLTLATARMLQDEGVDVILIERDKERIEQLSEQLDCGFLHGDAGSPDVLKEAEPENTDALFSLLDNEQTNIIVALVARSLKFSRVVPLVAESQFERICTELGLADTVAPNRAVARHLVNQIRGEKSLELAAIIHRDAEVFSFIVTQDEAGPLADFSLPKATRIICLYRHEKLVLPEETDRLAADDEVIVITRPSRLDELKRLWERPAKPDERSE